MMYSPKALILLKLMVFQLCLIGGLLILLIRKAKTDKELASEMKRYIDQNESGEEATSGDDN